jgi:23S rRNA (cytidine1920-2'-O)/16S rRNA (cytidine1409-2'-O)-methyltransferase
MKQRLDRIIIERGLVASRERARALIMEGKVLVENRPVTKAGAMVQAGCNIILKEKDIPYVSRGGVKLSAALEHFSIVLEGKIAMDVGASTGGFTDCMLSMGAARIYSIDVGYGQFDYKLRNDARVVLMERTNIRNLEKDAIPEKMDFAAVDVSFISLRLVLPEVREFMKPGGGILALIKPQFESTRKDVGKGGIIRDEEIRIRAVESIENAASECGLYPIGVMQSPIKGRKGNVEYFIYMKGE